jgi:hypothetical protein
MNQHNTEDFINKSKSLFGDKFDYSETTYISSKTKLKLHCKQHNNTFEISPMNHFILKGHGCKQCGTEVQQTKLRKKDFKETIQNNYKDKYTILDPYQQIHQVIRIKCNEHNIIFSLSPYRLLKGSNKCIQCFRNRKFNNFLIKAKEKWGDKYDYSAIKDYKRNDIKIPIRCKIHNLIFHQEPKNHLNFDGCPECFKESQRKIFSRTTQEFIDEATKVHKGFYDYSKTIYINQREKVEIICPIHGNFWVNPDNHLKGHDCQKCGYKKLPGGYFGGFFRKYPEKKTIPAVIYFYKFERVDKSYFYKLGISAKIKYRYSSKAYRQFKITTVWEESCTLYQAWKYEQILSKLLKLYSYVPPENFAGETECYSKEIPKPEFLNVFDNEWKNKEELILSRFNIKNHINEDLITKIAARKTNIQIVNPEDSKIFLETNHIQGNVNAKISLGLYYEDTLVSLMTFGKPRYNKNYDWELLRFANSLNTIVVGGASKLFSHFIKNNNPKNIISYSDNRWNKGNIYTTIGMKYLNTSISNYWYIKGDQMFSRIKCQKHKLKDLLEHFDPKKTEFENMKLNGFEKISDSGNSVFIWESKLS